MIEKNTHLGSNFDDFLKEEGIFEECESIAIKRVIAYQLQQFMREYNLSKTEMAKKLETSRSALDRLLNSNHTSITLDTIIKTAQVTGKKVRISFV